MTHRRMLLCAILCAVVLAAAGPAGQRSDMQLPDIGPPVPWTAKPLNNEDGTFHFAIISDLTGSERPGVFQKAVEKLNLLQPEFVMSIGDLIQGYSQDERVLAAQWKSFDRRLAGLQMRFFHVPGNHDIGGPSPAVAEKVWAAKLGPSYYHFVYRNVLLLCLNSEQLIGPKAAGAEADKQVAYVRKALEDNRDARWTFVFLHRPLWVLSEGRWPDIEKLLAERKHTVFCGHIHRYTKYSKHGQSYITLATTGGGMGSGVLKEGRFDHVAWVTVKDSGPVIANVLLDGVLDENVVTEQTIRDRLKETPLRDLVP